MRRNGRFYAVEDVYIRKKGEFGGDGTGRGNQRSNEVKKRQIK